MSKPLVDIIIVNYNNALDTIECVKSLNRITYDNYHVIIVDNGSSDSSVEVLCKEQDIVKYDLICLEDNKGFSAGNNAGIQYAMQQEAQYVLLLNNDTLVQPDFLTEMIVYLEGHEGCDAAIGKIYYADYPHRIWYAGGKLNMLTGKAKHCGYGKEELSFKEEKPSEVTFATGCCICLKASVINDVGFLDEDYFLYEEDSDYCYRMLRKGKHIIYIPSSIIYHKVSASTGAVSPLTQYYTSRNRFLFISKNFEGINKVVAFIYSYLLMIKRCIYREINFKYTAKGIQAYYRGEKGKKTKGGI